VPLPSWVNRPLGLDPHPKAHTSEQNDADLNTIEIKWEE